ncbi:MAG: carbamoyl-phosphate synthase large subunit [Thiohalorhabdus sp.]|uniref:carbamoyl-phosphate synthase large subunit n=1 Tax=Thiohalorhabdus sp. TaxID=3094134 RepID=UPI0039805BD1
MPKRTDLESILIIGSGPIVIGQACEFDYSGAQACKALREEGYRVILVNSNPATIMTDPEMADATYIEPLNWRSVAKVVEREKPDAILPTMGGQTGLNCALDLDRYGVLAEHGVELIGASKEAIDKAEDRDSFKQAMGKIGLGLPRSAFAHSMEEAQEVMEYVGFPTIIRPSFTMGGSGGGIAYNREEFDHMVGLGLEASPTNEVLLEESIIGWKEYEMEVVRDRADNCIIVCSIENLDPMGVHTGDSVTVAPAQTLTDKEYQVMRDASLAVLREIGVETGGSNVQFAVNPEDGRLVIIEMNPRVSRSSALASKATGFPIAKIAAKLAVGYTLDELQNDITKVTPASFEPSIDYVVTKIPRFTFEKFAQADRTLTTQMKSVGEVMAIGRTFQESFQKALRGLEQGSYGLEERIAGEVEEPEEIPERLDHYLRNPGPDRLWYIGDAFRHGMSLEEVFDRTWIDRWFLAQIEGIIEAEKGLAGLTLEDLDAGALRAYKRMGFADRRLAALLGTREASVRARRAKLGVRPVFKRVDTCAGEFESFTPYLYSSYEEECEARPTDRDKIMVLGSGPNRIGQGIEFDYACVHASLAMREDGYETIMVNCNPETVSTDYDTSDRLYFEPLTLEDVLAIVEVEQPTGVIVQFGGQTPLKLANDLEAAGVPIIGTSPDAIDLAEDRERFQNLIHRLGLKQPPNRIAFTPGQAREAAREVGYPLLVRPSYVLGGRAMEIVYSEADLDRYMTEAVRVSEEHPVLLDRFLVEADELDVDAVADGEKVVVGGLMEHIEEAGVHSGDSACSLPPHDMSSEVLEEVRRQTKMLAQALHVVGLINVQFAVQNGTVYVLEVNPRAARTVPFVSKATARPLAKIAARAMAGKTLAEQGVVGEIIPPFYSVKESVFPFIKFPGVDTLLGPEMKSTGEVMGVGKTFGAAYAKAQSGAGVVLPEKGRVFVSVRDADKEGLTPVVRRLASLGFEFVATRGTAAALEGAGVEVAVVNKVKEGRPHIVDRIKNGEIDMIINTASGKSAVADSYSIRRTALQHGVTYFTTLAGAEASAAAIARMREGPMQVRKLQELAQLREEKPA